MSAFVVLTGLVSVIWLALGRPKIRRGADDRTGSARGLRRLGSGGVALGLMATVLKHAIVIGAAAVAVCALLFLVLPRLSRSRRRRRRAYVMSQPSACPRARI
jgi:hypothetical protein